MERIQKGCTNISSSSGQKNRRRWRRWRRWRYNEILNNYFFYFLRAVQHFFAFCNISSSSSGYRGFLDSLLSTFTSPPHPTFLDLDSLFNKICYILLNLLNSFRQECLDFLIFRKAYKFCVVSPFHMERIQKGCTNISSSSGQKKSEEMEEMALQRNSKLFYFFIF